jgi:hypothetical protein
LRKTVSLQKNEKGGGRKARRGVWNKFVHWNPTVHHSNNPERSIPAESRVHQVPLDDTLMATADDFLLLELVPPVELELEAEPDAEGVLETVICPEIYCWKEGRE